MRCPTLAELPPPPASKTGWPWTEETPALPDTTPDGKPWPRFSIVTPSYNQADFLEETIRATLLQGYPDLEYIVVDGGSKDGSVEIIRRYEKWLAHWESEPDRGQTHAINKGFARATGEVCAYINSDDFHAKGAYQLVAQDFARHPRRQWLLGWCHMLGHEDDSQAQRPQIPTRRESWLFSNPVVQPAAFWKRALFDRLGLFDESLQFCFDYEFFARLVFNGVRCHALKGWTATFRFHGESKTEAQTARFYPEMETVRQRYLPLVPPGAQPKARLIAWMGRETQSLWEARGLLREGEKTAAWKRFARAITHCPPNMATRFGLGTLRRLLQGKA